MGFAYSQDDVRFLALADDDVVEEILPLTVVTEGNCDLIACA